MILGLYGPLEPRFDKTWRPRQIEPPPQGPVCERGDSARTAHERCTKWRPSGGGSRPAAHAVLDCACRWLAA